jgi:hypothetical protein
MELKASLDAIVNEEMKKNQSFEDQLQGWLGSQGLPGILNSVTSSDEIPQDIWTKIEEF